MEFKVCELNHFEEDILNTFIYCTQNDICSVGIIASNEIVSYVVDALIPFNCFSFNTKNDFHFENDNYLLYVDELKDILIESVTDENYIDLINQYNNSIFFCRIQCS